MKITQICADSVTFDNGVVHKFNPSFSEEQIIKFQEIFPACQAWAAALANSRKESTTYLVPAVQDH